MSLGLMLCVWLVYSHAHLLSSSIDPPSSGLINRRFADLQSLLNWALLRSNILQLGRLKPIMARLWLFWL